MLINNSNSMMLKYNKVFSMPKKHPFSETTLKNDQIKHTLQTEQDNKDKLVLSDEAQIEMKANKLIEDSKVQNIQPQNDPAAHTRVVEAESIIGGIIGVYKNQIENQLRDYYLSITDIINSPLNVNGYFDTYSPEDMSKEIVSNSTNTLDSSKELNTALIKDFQIDPSKNIVDTDNKALDQLEKNINAIIHESINNLNALTKDAHLSSKFDQDSVDGIKAIVKNLSASLTEMSLKGPQSETEFADTMKQVLGNMNDTQINLSKYSSTQVNINNYSNSEIENMSNDDIVYINKITAKFDSAVTKYQNENEYSMNLLHIVFTKV